MKNCSTCKKSLPSTEFHKDASKKDGLHNNCKTCAKELRRRRESNPVARALKAQKRRAWGLATNYGLTSVQYLEMYDAQEGKCAICKENPGGKWLAVDHCHKTGAVRGLLCSDCNLMLGNSGDRPDVLVAGAEYLHRSKEVPK